MTVGSVLFCWITAQRDRTEHAVSDDAQVAAMAAGTGVFTALCGSELEAASMDVGAAGRCSSCVAVLRARAELRDLDERMGERRPSWLSCLWCVPARFHQQAREACGMSALLGRPLGPLVTIAALAWAVLIRVAGLAVVAAMFVDLAVAHARRATAASSPGVRAAVARPDTPAGAGDAPSPASVGSSKPGSRAA